MIERSVIGVYTLIYVNLILLIFLNFLKKFSAILMILLTNWVFRMIYKQKDDKSLGLSGNEVCDGLDNDF